MSVFLPYFSGMQIESFLRHVILSSVTCLAVPYFPHYLIKETIFEGDGGGVIGLKMCFDFLYNFFLKYFLSEEEFREVLQTRKPGLRRRCNVYGTGWTLRASNPGRDRMYSVSKTLYIGSVAHSAPYSVRTAGLCRGWCWLIWCFDVGHSSTSISEVKNEWSCTSTPPACP